MQGDDQAPGSGMIPMFAQINALPCAQVQPPVTDGNRKRAADEQTLDVSGHVIRALVGVPVVGHVGRGQMPAEVRFQVRPHRRIGILVKSQRGGGVLNENMHQPHGNLADLGHLLQHVAGDEMKAAGSRAQDDGFLYPHAITCPERQNCRAIVEPWHRRLRRHQEIDPQDRHL